MCKGIERAAGSSSRSSKSAFFFHVYITLLVFITLQLQILSIPARERGLYLSARDDVLAARAGPRELARQGAREARDIAPGGQGAAFLFELCDSSGWVFSFSSTTMLGDSGLMVFGGG